MKRPWQVWTLYFLCLALVTPGMGWLTLKALELDRAREESKQQAIAAQHEAIAARHEAEQQEHEAEEQEIVASAMWRMDWNLTPIVAQEAARPYFVYDSFYAMPAGKGVQQIPSPLLVQPSEFVLLHFQVSPEQLWTSPQSPVGIHCSSAISQGTPADNIEASCSRLADLKQHVDYEELVKILPKEVLPPIQVGMTPWGNNLSMNYNGEPLNQGNPIVTKDLGIKQLKQQSAQQAEFQRGAFNQEDSPQQMTQANAQPAQQVSRGRGRGRGQEQQPQQVTPQRSSISHRQQLLRGYEWNTRNKAYEAYAQNQIVQQRVGNSAMFDNAPEVIREGVTRPVWLGSRMILARRVMLGDQVFIQGCWLDWESIKTSLLKEVSDVLPDADLVPVTSDDDVEPGRTLVTLPVQIVVPDRLLAATTLTSNFPESAFSKNLSPLQVSLIVAWSCMLVAAVASAVLLQGVVALSERRGAFVSAVTHELRTPLTTFRMYAEMLAEGMVSNDDHRQEYAETLYVEANRLSHLVENVLSYARLERGSPGKQREQVTIERLLGQVESRLRDRANQAEMEFEVDADEDEKAAALTTDPAAIEQVLFNLIDNACKYAASASDRRIQLSVSVTRRAVELSVRDYGPGILRHEAKRLFRPFSKSVQQAANSAPGVGLGLALSHRLARALGGRLELKDPPGGGAKFILALPRSG